MTDIAYPGINLAPGVQILHMQLRLLSQCACKNYVGDLI